MIKQTAAMPRREDWWVVGECSIAAAPPAPPASVLEIKKPVIHPVHMGPQPPPRASRASRMETMSPRDDAKFAPYHSGATFVLGRLHPPLTPAPNTDMQIFTSKAYRVCYVVTSSISMLLIVWRMHRTTRWSWRHRRRDGRQQRCQQRQGGCIAGCSRRCAARCRHGSYGGRCCCHLGYAACKHFDGSSRTPEPPAAVSTMSFTQGDIQPSFSSAVHTIRHVGDMTELWS